MAGNIKGITIEIGGDTQKLNKALEDVNKKSRDIQSELRQVEKLLKLDPKNTELLAQKQKLLAEAVANSKEKLDRLKAAQEQVNEQFRKGEISEEQYRAFQREVAKAEQELAGFEKQLSTTVKTTETWKDKLDKAQTSLKDFGAKMTDMGKNLSMKVTAPIVAVGAASFKMAADLEDAMGATDQIFAKASDSVKKWADGLDSYYGIAESEALEYANMMGTMLVNIGGLTEEQAAKQAQTLIGLAGDLTAMYGGTTADAVRALTGALKGNNTMLDNYGMAANDAMIKTKALEMGIYSGTGQMDLATKQAATLALIMEQSGAAQGQAAREAEGSSGAMRAFSTEMKNLSVSFGEHLLPTITPIISKLNELIKSFSELSPATQKTIIATAGFAAALGPAMTVAGNLMKVTGGLIKVFTKFGGVLLNLATKIGPLVLSFATRLGPMIAGLSGPVGIAVAAVVALIAIFAKLWQTSPKFRAWTRELGDSFANTFKVIINKFVDDINWAIEQLNRLPKVNIDPIGKLTKSSGTTGWADFRQLPGNAEGTNFWRGGLTWVGERGPELLNLPRGAQIYNNQESRAMTNQTLIVGGTIRVEGVNDMNQLVGVAQVVAAEMERGDRRLAGRVRVMPSMA